MSVDELRRLHEENVAASEAVLAEFRRRHDAWLAGDRKDERPYIIGFEVLPLVEVTLGV